jgi:hypothetical protein
MEELEVAGWIDESVCIERRTLRLFFLSSQVSMCAKCPTYHPASPQKRRKPVTLILSRILHMSDQSILSVTAYVPRTSPLCKLFFHI